MLSGLSWSWGALRTHLRDRSIRARLDRALEARAPLAAGRFEIGVHYADGPLNLYQLRRWYGPLAELAKTHPVLLLVRDPASALALLEESPVPVAFVPAPADVDALLAVQPLRIVLHVDHHPLTFELMGHGRRWHVFIDHGESDRTPNQIRAYDVSLVAGDAAVDRLGRVLWGYDAAQRAIRIGRPQADHPAGRAPFEPDGRTVVLYAPTWEGDGPATAYGSVASHGTALIRDLLASPEHRVIYRPHPRTGTRDRAYAAADREIAEAIAAANRADPAARHVHDTAPELGWQLVAADVAIVDVSAMVYDRLATGKPLLVTRPVAPDAVVDTAGYLSDCEWLTADEAPNLRRRLAGLSEDSAAAVRLGRWVTYHFGDTRPGAATRRFHAAIDQLLADWERRAAREAHDEQVDLV